MAVNTFLYSFFQANSSKEHTVTLHIPQALPHHFTTFTLEVANIVANSSAQVLLIQGEIKNISMQILLSNPEHLNCNNTKVWAEQHTMQDPGLIYLHSYFRWGRRSSKRRRQLRGCTILCSCNNCSQCPFNNVHLVVQEMMILQLSLVKYYLLLFIYYYGPIVSLLWYLKYNF